LAMHEDTRKCLLGLHAGISCSLQQERLSFWLLSPVSVPASCHR
jgi:hypothetical protein